MGLLPELSFWEIRERRKLRERPWDAVGRIRDWKSKLQLTDSCPVFLDLGT